MKKSELHDKILKITEIDQQLESFYRFYVATMLENKKPLYKTIDEEKIKFDLLDYYKSHEENLYATFSTNRSLLSYLSTSLSEETVYGSKIIPTYQKITENDLFDSKILTRIRSFLEDFSISLAFYNLDKKDPISIDSYYFSLISKEESEYVKHEVKQEFLEIFLSFLQINIDQNIQNTSFVQNLLLAQQALLMGNPMLESYFFSSLFVYDEKVSMDCSNLLEEIGVSPRCYDYFNEEFAWEQAIYNMTAIMTQPSFGCNYALNLLYLQSAIVLAKREDTLLAMENVFLDHYQKSKENFPEGEEKAQVIEKIFQEKEKIREGFVYQK